MELQPVHDDAHHAFVTLPAYAIPREDEVKFSGERDKIAYLRHYGTHPQHEQENEGLRGACSCQRRNQRLMRSYLCVLCSMICFNTLNVLLGGNLPPFGSAAVIVEEQDYYLVVELPRGRVVFPGGFMTWREDPKHTAQREAQEETGLLVRVDHLIGTYFSASDSFLNMSTVSCVYAAEVIGGVLRNGVEGRACWLHEEELRKRLSPHSRGILDDYLRSRPLQRGIPASSDSQMPLPLAS
jgi:ADP-ribose pyrophosphatase YjhB (NUDIX family)